MPHLTRLRQEVVNVMKICMFIFSHLKITYTSIYNKEISAKNPWDLQEEKKKRTGFIAYNTK